MMRKLNTKNITRIGSFLSSQASESHAGAPEDFLKSIARRKDPLTLFPWRHKDELPQRLMERKKNFRDEWLSYDWYTYYVSTVTAKMYLDVPLFSAIGNSWRKELAESCAWAFSRAINEIISDVYCGK